jgi:hypothetical protein
MFIFGTASLAKLTTVHPELKQVFELALSWQIYDMTIIYGWRGQADQEHAFLTNQSTKHWPDSNHNVVGPDGTPLSDAVDFAPWCRLPNGSMGIPWKDTHAFAVIGGILLAASHQLGYKTRYGGDWDMDGLTTDQKLMDWGHIERVTS